MKYISNYIIYFILIGVFVACLHGASWLMAYSLGIDRESNVFKMFKEFPELRENAPNFHVWTHLID